MEKAQGLKISLSGARAGPALWLRRSGRLSTESQGISRLSNVGTATCSSQEGYGQCRARGIRDEAVEGPKVGSAKGRAWHEFVSLGLSVTSAQELSPSTLPSTPFLQGRGCGSLLGSHRSPWAVCVTVSLSPTGP